MNILKIYNKTWLRGLGVILGAVLVAGAVFILPVLRVPDQKSGVSFIVYGPGGEKGGAAIPACGGSQNFCCTGGGDNQSCYYADYCYGYNSCGDYQTVGALNCGGICEPYWGPTERSGYGATCYSASNSCGSFYTGSNVCSGSGVACSVSTPPPNPPGYGSSCTVSNSCGASNSGTIGCSGGCSASAPPNPPGYGSSCTATNACGQSNSGSQQCDGSCSASAPALPPGYGSVCTTPANSCGAVNYGTIGCSGSCSVTTPPPNSSCTPPVIQFGDGSGGGGGGGGSSGEVIFVRPGTSCHLEWSASPATSCSLSGGQYGGGTSVSVSGTTDTNPLTRTTTYNLTCYNGSEVYSAKSTKCQIVPDLKEI